jgi:hypothetical protein
VEVKHSPDRDITCHRVWDDGRGRFRGEGICSRAGRKPRELFFKLLDLQPHGFNLGNVFIGFYGCGHNVGRNDGRRRALDTGVTLAIALGWASLRVPRRRRVIDFQVVIPRQGRIILINTARRITLATVVAREVPVAPDLAFPTWRTRAAVNLSVERLGTTRDIGVQEVPYTAGLRLRRATG